MKRFVTYLYECKRGSKAKNMGFIRVNVRENETIMEIYVRNFLKSNANGKIYALLYKKELIGIEIGSIEIENGQQDSRIIISTNDIAGTGYGLQELIGIGILLTNEEYIASCWKENHEVDILNGDFIIYQSRSEKPTVIQEDKEEKGLQIASENKETIYEKIDLSQIRELPSPNWYLATNSFLIHGFWNYGYLVLKKKMEKDKETLSLGVPGVFEKPEAVMALLFGFPVFEEIPSEEANVEINQPKEIATGTFGGWFTDIKL